jgi:hypothetical protein
MPLEILDREMVSATGSASDVALRLWGSTYLGEKGAGWERWSARERRGGGVEGDICESHTL